MYVEHTFAYHFFIMLLLLRVYQVYLFQLAFKRVTSRELLEFQPLL